MVLVLVNSQGQTSFHAWGETAPGSATPPTETSTLRLCSLTKIFTADVLARMAAQGTVHLNDSLAQWELTWAAEELRDAKTITLPPAPRRARVRPAAATRLTPERDQVPRITLEQLATHTAGLPREIGEGPRSRGHFTYPDLHERWDWLSTAPVSGTPGERALYSNVGFDFLSDALAQAAHQPYAQLLDAEVLKPLHMYDTTFYPTADQCAHLLQGAKDEGPCTATDATEGSSGLYSTPRDMAKWLHYLLAQGEAGAQKAVLTRSELGRALGLDHAGDPTAMGLGWVHILPLNSQDHIIQKTGGGAGFETYIAINHARGTALFLAVTEGDHSKKAQATQQLQSQNRGEHLNVFNAANNLLLAESGLPPLPEKGAVPVLAKSGAVVAKPPTARTTRHPHHHRV